MVADKKTEDSTNPKDTDKSTFGFMLQGIGGIALIAGIALSILQGILDFPIEGSTLGYLMVGGIIAVGIGEGLHKFQIDFKKEMDASNKTGADVISAPKTTGPQVTKLKALWESTVIFASCYAVLMIFIVLFMIMVDVSSIQNNIVRALTFIVLLGVPFIFSLFVGYGRYNRFDIIRKK